MVIQSNQIIKKKLFGGGVGFNPISILGAKLVYWFDNDNVSNITLNGSNVAQQIDETGNWIRKEGVAGSQPPYDGGFISPDGIADKLKLLTYPGLAPASTIIDDTQGFAMYVAKSDEGSAAKYIWGGVDESQEKRYSLHSIWGSTTNGNRAGHVWNNNGVQTKVWTTNVGLGTTLGYWSVSSNGVRYKEYLNGVEEVLIEAVPGENNGDWVGDASLIDNIYFYCLKRLTPIFSSMDENQAIYASSEPSEAELANLKLWADLKAGI